MEDVAADRAPAPVGDVDNSPRHGVNNDVEDDYPSQPSMQEVVVVEADLEKGYEGIVAPGQQNQRDHIGGRQRARASSQLST